MGKSKLEWRQGGDKEQTAPLSLQNVHISYKTRRGSVQAVRGVTVDLLASQKRYWTREEHEKFLEAASK